MNGLEIKHLPALKERLKEAKNQLANAVIDLNNYSSVEFIPSLEVDVYAASMMVILLNEKINKLDKESKMKS